MSSLRVIVADDHALLRESVAAVLSSDDQIDVVGTAGNAEELLPLVARELPDVVVLDVSMPGTSGLGCLAEIGARSRRTKVVMLSGLEDPWIVRQSLQLGASAFVRKSIDPDDLGGVLRQVVDETVVSQVPEVQDVDAEAAATQSSLTKGERGVLEALARGLVNKQIAAELSIAPQTVKFHLTNIYRKLGVANRTEAVRLAYDRGLVARGVSGYA